MAIAGLAGCIAAGIFGFHMMSKYRQLTQLNNFYEMRRSQMALVSQHDSLSATEKRSLRDKRLRLLAEYEKYLEKVDWYTQKSPKEKAVMRLARNLGETSLEVPQDFIAKALEGVEKWKSTSRLARDLAHAREQNLIARIRSVLDQYDLPREFVFIALQESDFEPKAVGPETNFGIAKGMWQLMPPTASDYGLKIGPLKDSREYDPMDERHIADLSTQAAAKHLAFLYSSKAAASGLLVIASYNYGQTRIIKKLDSLPNEPSQRNFWNFYRHGWVPDETQKYVMSIFSAALLCENPALFGFDSEAIDKYW
jgi:membrane-bound lytic murein transglycosylase D